MQSSLEWFGESCITRMIYLYPELAHLPIKTGKVRMMAWVSKLVPNSRSTLVFSKIVKYLLVMPSPLFGSCNNVKKPGKITWWLKWLKAFLLQTKTTIRLNVVILKKLLKSVITGSPRDLCI